MRRRTGSRDRGGADAPRLTIFGEASAIPARPATAGREALVAATGALAGLALAAAGLWLVLGGALHAGLWALAIGLVVIRKAAAAYLKGAPERSEA